MHAQWKRVCLMIKAQFLKRADCSYRTGPIDHIIELHLSWQNGYHRVNYQQYLLFNLNNASWPDRKPHSVFIVPAPTVDHWILLSLKKTSRSIWAHITQRFRDTVDKNSVILYDICGEDIIQISIQYLQQWRALDKAYAPPRLITVCNVHHTIQASNVKVQFLMYCRSALSFVRVASMPSP